MYHTGVRITVNFKGQHIIKNWVIPIGMNDLQRMNKIWQPDL